MPGRSSVSTLRTHGAVATARGGGSVTVERFALDHPTHVSTQITTETILAGILQTPTVWMDFGAAPDCELELPLPLTRCRLAPASHGKRRRPARRAIRGKA